MMYEYTLQNVGSLIDKIRDGSRAAAIRGIQSAALELERDIKSRFINESGLGTFRGRYKAGWRTESLPDGAMVVNSVPYAAVIEYGRRPGAPIGWNMVLNLLDWLKTKGKGKGQATLEHAWASALWIRQHGLFQPNGLRILSRATQDIQARVAKHVKVEMGKL